MRSGSSPSICSRLRASARRRRFSISAIWSNMATRRKSSPTRAKPVPRITSPAATAECGGRFMATTTGHTVKAFDADLDELRALISQMGGLAEAAIADAVQALARKDTDLALRVIEGDKKIDQIEVDVERLAVRLIALRAPMADDLREVVAALKTAGVIERIGDYAKNIAKRVAIFAESHPN